MIQCSHFCNLLQENQIEFFAGVPDSLLKNVCAYITNTFSAEKHIITPNEGSAIALGAGYHLATGKIPFVYMQNSGLGNTINPLTSLTDPEVYAIPMLLMIGWRGVPGVKDEPQHVKKGRITPDLLDCLEIPYQVLPKDWEHAQEVVSKLIHLAKTENRPVALLIEKDTFDSCKLEQPAAGIESQMVREEAIEILIENLPKNATIVSTTGKTSRELYEVREANSQPHSCDFLSVGSMGHTSSIAQAVAMNMPDETIYCFDGDGAALMHLGAIPMIGSLKSSNMRHIIFNNAAHESVGGQPTICDRVDLVTLAKSCGYSSALSVSTPEEIQSVLPDFIKNAGPSLLEIKIKVGSRADLGRPKETPIESKSNFMKNLMEKANKVIAA